MKQDLIEIARIKGPSGLSGKIRVSPLEDSYEGFSKYKNLCIGRQGVPKRVLSCTRNKNTFTIELEGIDSVKKVECLTGEGLFISRKHLPPESQGEYYRSDLIGLKVINTREEFLGELIDIFSTGSNDVYVIDKIKQYYIPATRDVIRDIDIERGIMTIDTSLIEDLFE